MTRAQRESISGYLFIAPQFLGFVIFVLGPIIAVFVFSLQSRSLLTGQSAFIGLDNFRRMFIDDRLFLVTMRNTLVFAGGLVPLNIALALALALALSRPRSGLATLRTVFFAPVVTSAVAWAIVWRFLLEADRGLINQYLAILSIEGPNWLREPGWAMLSVIVTRVIKNVGLNMVIFLAAVTNVPEDYYEAATIEGAGPVRKFRSVTFPLIMPTTMMVLVITIVGSFKVFDHIMLMTQGGPGHATTVLVYYIYFQGFQVFRTGYASALSVLLFAVVFALTIAQWSVRKRLSHYET